VSGIEPLCFLKIQPCKFSRVTVRLDRIAHNPGRAVSIADTPHWQFTRAPEASH